MFKDLNSGINSLNRMLIGWAGKQVKNTWEQRKRTKVAEEALNTIVTFGASQAELEEAYTAIMEGAHPNVVINHYRQLAENKRRLENPPPIHGSSRWALRQDLKPKGLLQDFDKHIYTGKGLYLGGLLIDDPQTRALKDNWLFWDSEGHITTVAATGSGKSRYMLIPNLLRYDGSCVVHDPKGELYNATSDYRKTIGKVYRIAPFEEKTHSVNPLSQIESMDDARALAELLLPRKSTGDAQFYDDEAINFLSAFILYIATIRPGQDMEQKGVIPGTIDELRERTAVMSETLRKEMELLSRDYMPRSVRRAAQVAMTKSMDKGLPSLIQSLNQSMAIWDTPGLVAATSINDFDFRDLKNETVTVYLHIPLEKMQAYKQFMQIMLTTALDAMTKNSARPRKPVLFIMDEFLTLGHFAPFLGALRTHRDAGVRLWYLMQDVASVKETYPENWNSFFSQTSLRTYFGTNELSEAEIVSEQTGMTTVAYENASLSSSTQNTPDSNNGPSESVSQNSSIQYAGRPLMTPDETISLLSQAEGNGSARFAISRMNNVAQPICHIMTAWDGGEFGVSRFGGPLYVYPSPYLKSIFDTVNEQAFGGNQSYPKSGIAWVDFSMGRGGHTTIHELHCHYQLPLDRIAFNIRYYALERVFIDALENGTAQDSDEVARNHDLLYRLMLHEMIHREVGDMTSGHNEKFKRICQRIYEHMGGENSGLRPPCAANLSLWPYATSNS